jgi:putative PIN family toxin of toxin-antitoxin system
MRVVLDTNVFISSFFGGNPRKIIDLWKSGKIILCLSNTIVEEYIEVLSRLGLQTEKELQELLKVFAEGFNIQFTANAPVLDVVKDDADDNKFVECAVALNCSYIISGDKHLINLKNYMGIKILNSKDFLTE